ncbi:MAG: ABC transporter substrate-binding protein, partial [Oscillibacter sp.]|nr:ABC transporter substrate-binding protein [Oscillibacter sp.]
LAEAGYDGKTYTIAFASKRQNMAALLVQQWAEAGINVEMTVVDVATMFAGLADGSYDMGISGHTASTYSLWFEAEFPANDNPILDPARMDYVYRIRSCVDEAEKTALVQEYQRYLAGRTYFIPLYFSGSYWVESRKVSGIRNSASLMCNDNVWQWRVQD